MTETVVCPLWDEKDGRLRGRHYTAWDRRCGACGRKVIVSYAIERRIEIEKTVSIVCEQCALTQPEEPTIQTPAEHIKARCAICDALKRQLDEALQKRYEFENSPDRKSAKRAYRKWAHLQTALLNHRRNAHG